jgi:S-adenosylmethionine decarboxylase
MHGLHLTADLHGCPSHGDLMTNTQALRALCLREVEAAGLQAVNALFHGFDPGPGITGVVLLAESHLAIHTWPELGAVTLDVYVCNFGADNAAAARSLMAALVQAFEPRHVQQQAIERGAPLQASSRATASPRNIASSNTE